jgi:hypothetical protein
MPIFTATIVAQAVTLACDIFEITSPSTSRIRIREIRLGQYTDFGDAAAEILSVQVIRGHRVAGSNAGPTTVTPRNIHGWAGAPTDAASVIRAYDTGVATDTGSGAQVLISDAWNVQAGWWYYPPEEEMIILETSQRLVVRLSVPADALTLNGTLVYEIIGKVPG